MSSEAPSTVDSSWLWNQLNTTAASNQFIPGADNAHQTIQYNNALVSGNVDAGGGGGGGTGMIVYQLSADGTIDPSSGLMSSGEGLLEVGEVPAGHAVAQHGDTSRDVNNSSMLYQLGMYGDVGGDDRQWGSHQMMGGMIRTHGGGLDGGFVVDVEKQQLRSALAEKGKECERLVVELQQAYFLIHHLKQQNDIYQRHWAATQTVLNGGGCVGSGGENNMNIDASAGVEHVSGDNRHIQS